MNSNAIKIVISVCTVALIILRFIFPYIKIDTITLSLAVLAILPWLTSIIESAKFPGGWEVKFRDLDDAGKKVNVTEEKTISDKEVSNFKAIEKDANILLVSLRIEIEKRLRELAGHFSINEKLSLTGILSQLQQEDVQNIDQYEGLLEIIKASNKAAHGAKVEPSIAEWALHKGPIILNALDTQIKTTEKVNLRSGPGISFTIIKRIPKSVLLATKNIDGDWIEVSTKDGDKGWVSKKFVQTE